MNFWTSVLAVFIADAILSALGYNSIQGIIILAMTSAIYLLVSKIIDMWNAV